MRRCRLVLPSLLAALSGLALASCGGSSAKSKQVFTIGLPAITQSSVLSTAALDPTNRVGDLMTGALARLLMRFDISALPPGAIIVEATLIAPQTEVQGDPYGDLFPIIQIDRVNIGADIDGVDYDSPALQAIIGALGPNTDMLENKTANVTSAVQQDVDNNFQVTDLRLYFASLGDLQFDNDYAAFGSGNTALLTVMYQEP